MKTFILKFCRILLRMRNVSGEICRENQNTRFMFMACFRTNFNFYPFYLSPYSDIVRVLPPVLDFWQNSLFIFKLNYGIKRPGRGTALPSLHLCDMVLN
jgi:hypothetical protein